MLLEFEAISANWLPVRQVRNDNGMMTCESGGSKRPGEANEWVDVINGEDDLKWRGTRNVKFMDSGFIGGVAEDEGNNRSVKKTSSANNTKFLL